MISYEKAAAPSGRPLFVLVLRVALDILRNGVVGLVGFAKNIARICGDRDRARTHVGAEAQDAHNMLAWLQRNLRRRMVRVGAAASRERGTKVPATRRATAHICDVELNADDVEGRGRACWG